MGIASAAVNGHLITRSRIKVAIKVAHKLRGTRVDLRANEAERRMQNRPGYCPQNNCMAVPTITFRGGVLEVVLTLSALLAASTGTASTAARLLIAARNVLLFISHIRDCPGTPALPAILAPPQAPTRLGELRPPAPDRGAQSAGTQAQTAGQRPVVVGGLERMVAKLACRVDHLPNRDRHRRLATSRVQDVLALEVPASRRTTPKGCCADSADSADVEPQPDLGQSAHP
jgi:hypothetical protein